MWSYCSLGYALHSKVGQKVPFKLEKNLIWIIDIITLMTLVAEHCHCTLKRAVCLALSVIRRDIRYMRHVNMKQKALDKPWHVIKMKKSNFAVHRLKVKNDLTVRRMVS